MNTSFTRQRSSAHGGDDTLIGLVRRWIEQLGQAPAPRLADPEQPANSARLARDSQLLRQAVHANSPFELDWLWCAANMADPVKRRYCLERALAINPNSELANRASARLEQE